MTKIPSSFFYLRMLHIEDDSLMVSLVKRLLRLVHQYVDLHTKAALCLSDGLLELQTNTYDLVLLDLELPDSNGIETFHHVHGATDLPIVVLTAEANLYKRIETISAGAQDCIYKAELTHDVLLRSIRFAVERHRHLIEMRHALKELRASNLALEDIVEELKKRRH